MTINLNDFSDFGGGIQKKKKNGKLTLKSHSKSLSSTGERGCTDLYLSIWKGSYPKKVKIFIGELSHSCLNTQDKLQGRSQLLHHAQGWGKSQNHLSFSANRSISFGIILRSSWLADYLFYNIWTFFHSICVQWTFIQDRKERSYV